MSGRQRATRKELGRKSKRNGLFILGGLFLVFAARFVYFQSFALEGYPNIDQARQDGQRSNSSVLEEPHQPNSTDESAAVKTGNDTLEQPREFVTVVDVATDIERTQLLKLAHFAHETVSSMGLDIFAMGGTLLGGLRHHDFIPWDDDMDFYVVLNNWSQVLEIHKVFEQRGKENPHPEWGPIGKTAPNLTPHCWKQPESCNVTDELPHGRPYLGMFRTHFMSSRKVGWRYDYNCTKEDDRWCSRWPSVDIFMFLKTNDDQLQNIIGWPGPKTISVQEVYPLRNILHHGVLFQAPANVGNFLMKYNYPGKDWEFGQCNGGGNHRGGGMVHFKANCTQLWDQLPFVLHRNQTGNETVEIAYRNGTIVSVLKLDEKGKSTYAEWNGSIVLGHAE